MKRTSVSTTKIKDRQERKRHPQLIQTIEAARKQKAWVPIAYNLSGPTRKFASINLRDIDKKTTAGDTVVILGKVLAVGEVTKKIRVCALAVSASAREKLSKTKSEVATILDEIKINPKAQGLKLIN